MKFNLYTTFILLVLPAGTLLAQSFEWADRFGGSGNDYSTSITTDPSGNVYVTGSFQGTVDFDPGPGTYFLTASGSRDIYICKLDLSGNLVWALQYGLTGSNEGLAIIVESGNVYCTGSFNDSLDFDPGPGSFYMSSHGYDDIFILKLDASGSFLWARQMGGPGDEQGNALAGDAHGHIYVGAHFRDTVYYGPGNGNLQQIPPGAAGSYDGLICRFDTAGNLNWSRSFGGTSQTLINDLASDADGNIIITGDFAFTSDFDPGTGVFNLTSTGISSYDVFVTKLDSSGDFSWAKHIGGNDHDFNHAVVTDNAGNHYITGQFSGIVDFDPGNLVFLMNSVWGYMFICKWNASGNFVWAKQFGLGSFARSTAIAVDASCNIYSTGYFFGNPDFDPGPGSYILQPHGGHDVFVNKLDSAGNFQWAVSSGGPGQDWGYALTVDLAGNVYTTGQFYDTADFDPGANTINLVSAGMGDVFIQKLSPFPVGVSMNGFIKDLKVFPNPVSQVLTIELPASFPCVEFEMCNILSQVVQKKTFGNSNRLTIEMNVPQGFYLITLKDSDGNKAVVKVVKE